MLEVILKRGGKSNEMMAFEYWLRTGIRVVIEDVSPDDEQKFNPYHDPRDGRFTFAPGGGTLPPRVMHGRRISSASSDSISGRQGVSAGLPVRRPDGASTINAVNLERSTDPSPAKVEAAADSQRFDTARLQNAQFRPNPRVRIGGNGPPANDPMIVEHVFPLLAQSPRAGAIFTMADNIFDLTGPSVRLTTELANAHVNLLVNQIKKDRSWVSTRHPRLPSKL